jgi:transcriptional regulator with XRE-family HTH domain
VVTTPWGQKRSKILEFLEWFSLQETLAEHADLDRSYIAGIEVGARNPSLKALERLAAALSVTLGALFDR